MTSGWAANVCRPGDLGPAEIDAWHRFQSAAPELANPFLSPEFAVAAGAARPSTRVAVVSHEGELAGFLAFDAGPLGVAQPVAPGMCDQQAFVHRPGLSWQPAQVVAAAGLRAWRFDHLVGGQATPGTTATCSWVIDLAGGWPGYRARSLAERPRYVKDMERKTRRWWAEHPDTRFSYGAADPPGLSALFALKADQCRRLGWEDFLARPWVRQLVEHLAGVRTSALTAGLSALRLGERVVAADFSLRSSSTYAGWLIAYDHALSDASPGVVRWRSVIEAAGEEGLATLDLGKGTDEFKRRYATGTVPLAEGLWTAPGPVGRAAARADRSTRQLRSRHPEWEARARSAVRAGRRRLRQGR